MANRAAQPDIPQTGISFRLRHAKTSCSRCCKQKQEYRPILLILQGKHLSKYESRCQYHKGPFHMQLSFPKRFLCCFLLLFNILLVSLKGCI